MDKDELLIPELNEEKIESMIYEIRGQKVMLDFELAKLYGYETRDFNNQIKHNIERFDDDFRFQLNEIEWNEFLLWKKSTAINLTKRRTLPYAFTEQGIYMLMTVLKGDLAVKQSKILIKTFKQMKDYIVENSGLLLNTNSYIESKFSSYDKRFEIIENKIDVVMDSFIDNTNNKHFLILDGNKIEADIAYQSIYKLAKYSIYIIDDYIDVKTIKLLKICNTDINIMVFTDNKAKNNIDSNFINDFRSDTGLDISFKVNNNRFHDRYIIIDYGYENESLYHSGASIKDAGNKITTISKLEDTYAYNSIIDAMMNNEDMIIK